MFGSYHLHALGESLPVRCLQLLTPSSCIVYCLFTIVDGGVPICKTPRFEETENGL
jgi:hypothetical protein